MPQRIDRFIAEHLGAASSDTYSAVKSSAEAARAHGFTTCANSRYADFLAAFRSSPALAKSYADRYPSCVFLPWEAFHNVRHTLQLWCDLPGFYAGAIPSEQLPWLDLFALEPQDLVPAQQLLDLLETSATDRRNWQMMLDWLSPSSMSRYSFEATLIRTPQRDWFDSHGSAKLTQIVQRFQTSFFVLAPPEAFTSKQDFIERARRLLADSTRPTIPPDDPLVVRFCHGGCLVVAAWGEEAAELNNRVQAIGI